MAARPRAGAAERVPRTAEGLEGAAPHQPPNAYLMAFFVFNMGIQTIMYLAVTYAKEVVKDHGPDGKWCPSVTKSPIDSILLIQLVAAVGAMLFVRVSQRFGNLAALTIACGILAALCVAAYGVHWASEFLPAGRGGAGGGSQAFSRSTYAKFLPDTTTTRATSASTT